LPSAELPNTPSDTSFGIPLRDYNDWTMYAKKDQGTQTDRIRLGILSFIQEEAPSPIDSCVTNPNTQGLAPFDSISNKASSGIDIEIKSPSPGVSPIDSAIERSRSPLEMPGGFSSESPLIEVPISNIPGSPLVIPGGFIPESPLKEVPISGIEESSIPFPDSRPVSVTSSEPLKVLPKFGAGGLSRLPLPESTEVSQVETSEPLRVLPKFGAGGLSRLPLPESTPSSVGLASSVGPAFSLPSQSVGGEPIEFTRGRFASLSLDVRDPFSDTPVLTPEPSIISQSSNSPSSQLDWPESKGVAVQSSNIAPTPYHTVQDVRDPFSDTPVLTPEPSDYTD
jgi:hypothetical protein